MSIESAAAQTALPADRPTGNLEVVATLHGGPMPTGITVSHMGRIFLNFPHWGDPSNATVMEWKNGKAIPFPEGLPQSGAGPAQDRLVSVQSVVVDDKDRLWILDTGSVEFAPSELGGPKLIGVNLKNNRVFQTILFPRDVAPATSYLNDVRFDYSRGKAGLAFITDSSAVSNAIVVVDLATGESWRRLNDDPTTKADGSFQPYIEGEAFMSRPANGPATRLTFGADGIAMSSDHSVLYYCPLISRHLYSVSIAALADRTKSDAEVAATIKDLGDKGMSDGLDSDAEGRVYMGDLEGDSIRRRNTDGSYEPLAHDPRILWADTLSIGSDGYLYFTANQLHRQAGFHEGKDLRDKQYVIFRLKIDGHRNNYRP